MKLSIAEIRKRFSEDIIQLNPELFAEYEQETGQKIDLATVNQVAQEPKKRGNKYGAHKMKVGDMTFDSKAEARRWADLRDMVHRGEISSLMRQVRINLLEGFTYHGEKVRGIWYTCDFSYERDGILYIEDTKSVATARTEAFRLRWRLLQWKFRERQDVMLVLTDGQGRVL